MAPELDLAPGQVLCPACSGLGVWLRREGDPLPCGLCGTEAQVPEDVAESFWAVVSEVWEVGWRTREKATERVMATWP